MGACYTLDPGDSQDIYDDYLGQVLGNPGCQATTLAKSCQCLHDCQDFILCLLPASPLKSKSISVLPKALGLLDLGTCSGMMYPALRCTLMVSSGASSVNHCPLLWTADLGDDGGGDRGDNGGDG